MNLLRKFKLWLHQGWELEAVKIIKSNTFSTTIEQTWKHYITGEIKVHTFNRLNYGRI